MKVVLSFLPLSLLSRPSPPSAPPRALVYLPVAGSAGSRQLAALPRCPGRFRAKHSPGKITRLPGGRSSQTKSNRTQTDPLHCLPEPEASPRPRHPRLSPLPHRYPWLGGVFASPGSGGCVEAPTVCVPRGRKSAGVFEGKGDKGFCSPPSPYGGCFLRRC